MTRKEKAAAKKILVAYKKLLNRILKLELGGKYVVRLSKIRKENRLDEGL